MAFYFTIDATSAVRRIPADTAEMVSQLVFGDTGRILERKDCWWRIFSFEDKVEGWVRPASLLEISAVDHKQLGNWRFMLDGGVWYNDESLIRLPLGARIPVQAGVREGTFVLNGHVWEIDPGARWIPPQPFSNVVSLAERFLNVPYLWGGKSGFGIDAPGLCQAVYRMCGTPLPHDLHEQFRGGLSFDAKKRKAGDLVFLKDVNQTQLSHVGIVGAGKAVIHAAASRVRVDLLAEEGILHAATRALSHELVGIKRY